MAKKKQPKPPPAPVVESLDYILPDLRPLAVPIADLLPDPANCLQHGEEDLTATAASLRVYGQRSAILVNRSTKIVIAGNGRLMAAKALGWTHLAVVWADDDPATAAGYSIADNRTGRLAEWDAEAVDRLLRSIQTEDEDLAAMFDALAVDLDIVPGEETGGDQGGGGEDVDRKFQIIVECKDEAQQLELLEKFGQEGLECKALTI